MDLISAGELEAALARSFCTLLRPKSIAVEAPAGTGAAAADAAPTGAALTGAALTGAALTGAALTGAALTGAAAAGEEGGAFAEARPASLS
jgi:hypothetical protein